MQKIVIILSIFALIASCCGQTTRKQAEVENDAQDIQDTLIFKREDVLNESVARWYSKSYSYYWLVGKDTLDFKLRITESIGDGELRLRLSHKEPILFTDVLMKIDACLPLIKEDFDISKLTSINFKEPIFYLDLATKLSSEYEQEFGRKGVGYDKLLPFLLKSSMTSQLNHFLNPLNKKVRRCGFEKFQLLDKENYKEYLSDVDFTEYPEFTLNGYTGMDVILENK